MRSVSAVSLGLATPWRARYWAERRTISEGRAPLGAAPDWPSPVIGSVTGSGSPGRGLVHPSGQLLGPLPLHQVVDQLVQVALLDHPGEVVDGDVDPMVGHAALGIVVGADLLGALARPHLGPTSGGLLPLLFVLCHLEQSRSQVAHGLLLVLSL